MRNHWKKEEIIYLKKEYCNNKNKDLANKLKKTESSINNKAYELNLKKDKEFYCKARRHLPLEINKKKLEELYLINKISIRRIAKELNVGKTTIEYYFNKYKIKRRDKSEANKERFKWDIVWTKGKSKEKDPRLKNISNKLKIIWGIRKQKRIKNIELKFNKTFRDLLNQLYWIEGLSLEKIGKKLGYDRVILSNLFKEYDINLRPNFQYISSLKGANHSHFGKSWEIFFGKEKAYELRKKASVRARKAIIRRISNNEFPFFNTKIELKLSEEMTKRDISFISQFNIDNRFVCDFAIPSSKLVIECDGDYWHGNPSLYNKEKLGERQKINIYRDKIKDKYINKKGWKILRFFESDIKKSPIRCVNEIERHINNPLLENQ